MPMASSSLWRYWFPVFHGDEWSSKYLHSLSGAFGWASFELTELKNRTLVPTSSRSEEVSSIYIMSRDFHGIVKSSAMRNFAAPLALCLWGLIHSTCKWFRRVTGPVIKSSLQCQDMDCRQTRFRLSSSISQAKIYCHVMASLQNFLYQFSFCRIDLRLNRLEKSVL